PRPLSRSSPTATRAGSCCRSKAPRPLPPGNVASPKPSRNSAADDLAIHRFSQARDSLSQMTSDPENQRTPLSVLDLAHIGAGFNATQALRNSVELARAAERLGYRRYWFAEHHGMPSIASSAPEILIGHIASATETIRVGSGGIMLPNHAPLRIAEAFHTLEALHPGRIDLGIGRAPGSDRAAMAAMR